MKSIPEPIKHADIAAAQDTDLPVVTEEEESHTTSSTSDIVSGGVVASVFVFGSISATKAEMAEHQFGSAIDHTGYHSIDAAGQNTGIGYSFEDLQKKMLQKQGFVVYNGDQRRNGYDLKVISPDGSIDYQQLKTNPQGLYDKKTGEYRYGNQTVVVPKGEGVAARRICDDLKKKDPEQREPVRIIESGVSRDEALKNTYRGFGSAIIDAKQITPRAAVVGLAVGSSYLLSMSIVYFFCANKEKQDFMRRRVAIYGANMFGLAVLGYLLTLLIYICSAQLARPSK